MGSFLVAFATVSRQELVGLALGSRWGRPSPLAVALLEQVDPPQRPAPEHRLPREPALLLGCGGTPRPIRYAMPFFSWT